MQTVHETTKPKYDHAAWYLLAEYMLNGTLTENIGGEFTAGPLFQTLLELGLPIEYLNNILDRITEAARGVLGEPNREYRNFTLHINLYCHRKLRDCRPHVGMQLNSGWGYYLIERESELPNAGPDKCHHDVELYLYKEGD